MFTWPRQSSSSSSNWLQPDILLSTTGGPFLPLMSSAVGVFRRHVGTPLRQTTLNFGWGPLHRRLHISAQMWDLVGNTWLLVHLAINRCRTTQDELFSRQQGTEVVSRPSVGRCPTRWASRHPSASDLLRTSQRLTPPFWELKQPLVQAEFTSRRKLQGLVESLSHKKRLSHCLTKRGLG